ncbi:hypothetical protein RHSIM_Rhsim13G0065100 [Rhododendron simsii]|uniref:LOB domain-containing protein n=1 Tax=Rhododendron simsii TaxID=118357 RepID=A0A834FYU0_RHOSS|nr:hypothetical protein RHSIM_Rhsim13G0065100 [Rhododendron simsii]
MGGSSPCASCKLLRRRCAKDCVFAPYFPPDDPHKFAIVHKELPLHQRSDAVSSLVFEANARMRDPVYGCVGAISFLQNQVSQLQMQLAVAQAEILCIQMQQINEPGLMPTTQMSMDDSDERSVLLSSNSTSTSNMIMMSNQQFPQYLGFANSSSASSVIVQDPRKREPLWT